MSADRTKNEETLGGGEMTLPADISVIAEGRGEYRRVVLSIEGTTFELHPEDARLIGAALIDAAGEAEQEPEAST